MAITHVIDTSVATRLNNPAVEQRLLLAVSRRRIGRTRITDLERGFSARNGKEWSSLVGGLEPFPLIETLDVDLAIAADVQRRLSVKGQRGRKLPDLIIAATAHRLGLTVLHYDADFDLIAAETGQECEWVVPRGSID
ncbi:MAG: PIN domain-containing protein [Candidatus Nanopelagicales bacterium]